MKTSASYVVTSIFVLFLAGCSSHIPKQISTAPTNDLQLYDVQNQIEKHSNKEVRWGGELVSVENSNQSTLIEIVQYPLNHYGKPLINKDSQGRFVAETNEFIDPVVYKKGTLLTFSGTLKGSVIRKVDEKDLTMPVMQINNMYRWQPYRSIQRDPFYDPFYYNGFYPYTGYYNRYWYHPRFGYRYYYW